jgi:xyloglucan-specific endo-beta-1,4-glucanase
LGRYGDVYPIGSSTGTVAVAGRTWDLWIGMNGNMKVYSFVAPQIINSFSADVKQFFSYLQDSQGFPAASQNLIGMTTLSLFPNRKAIKVRCRNSNLILVFQFGTEAFTGGPATMAVSLFSANIL